MTETMSAVSITVTASARTSVPNGSPTRCATTSAWWTAANTVNSRATPATAADVEALRGQVQSLIETVKSLQQQVKDQQDAIAKLTVEPGALRTLQAYPWPGNIRELRNFCENRVKTSVPFASASLTKLLVT